MAEKKDLLTQLGIAKEDKELRKEVSFFLLKQEMILRQQYLAKSTSPMSSSSSLEDGQFYIVQLPGAAGTVDATMSSSRNKDSAMWRNVGMDGNTDDRNTCNGQNRDDGHDEDAGPCGKDWGDDDDNISDAEDTTSDEDIPMGGFGSDDDDVEQFDSSTDDIHHDVDTAAATDYGELISSDYADFISSDYAEFAFSEYSDDDEGSEYGDQREHEPVISLDDEDFMPETDGDNYEVFTSGSSLTRH